MILQNSIKIIAKREEILYYVLRKMKYLALDVGDVRIGIAMSDMLGIIANGYETYVRKKNESDFVYLNELVKNNEIGTVVVGLPVNMSGDEGNRAKIVRDFAAELQKHIDIPIVFQDERLSTVSAERILLEADVSRNKRKTVIDKIAATIILQSYLDKK